MAEVVATDPTPINYRAIALYYSGAAAMGGISGGVAGYLDGKPNNPTQAARYNQITADIQATDAIVQSSQNTLDTISEHQGADNPTVRALRQEVTKGQQRVADLKTETKQLDLSHHHDPGSVLGAAALSMAFYVGAAGAIHGLHRLASRNSYTRFISK